MTIKVAILRDDTSFGERTFETIRQKIETEIVELEYIGEMFIDDVELDENIVNKLSTFDLIITYIRQKDMLLEIVDCLQNKVSTIIIGIWKGEGFKNQLLKYENIFIPELICELEANTKNQVFNEFVKNFGKPEIKITCQGMKIVEIDVIRSSPCGATNFLAKEMIGNEVENIEDEAIRAGLTIQHYPCKGHNLEIFSKTKSSHQEISSKLHYEAVKKALKDTKKSKKSK